MIEDKLRLLGVHRSKENKILDRFGSLLSVSRLATLMREDQKPNVLGHGTGSKRILWNSRV